MAVAPRCQLQTKVVDPRLAAYLYTQIYMALFTCLGSCRHTQIDVIFIDIFVLKFINVKDVPEVVWSTS